MTTLKRREFLRHLFSLGGGALMLGSPLVARATQLGTSSVEMVGFKAMVCLDLRGGNDGTNTVIPNSDDKYARYQTLRQGLAIDRTTLLPIDPAGMLAGEFALHPSLPGIQQLFNQGNAAIVANVGPKIDRVGAIGTPPKARGHSAQSRYWLGVDPLRDAIDNTGWFGRLAEQIVALDVMSASVGGKNEWQRSYSASRSPYIMDKTGPLNYLEHADPALEDLVQALSLDASADHNALVSEAERYNDKARTKASAYTAAMNTDVVNAQINSLTTPFPASALGQQLETILRAILARDTFAVRRQSFYARQGGYDKHANQLTRHVKLLSELDAAVSAFHSALVQLGLADQVTLFTTSEFGRTTTTNGSGTDHGWGSHHFVVGGSVIGKQIYGDMPAMALNGIDMTAEKGILIPGLSIEQYAATLASWFGIPDSALSSVLPHINQFTVRDLGFMRS